MPYVSGADTWNVRPPRGPYYVDRSGPWASNLRGCAVTDRHMPWDAIRGSAVAPSATAVVPVSRFGPRAGHYSIRGYGTTQSWTSRVYGPAPATVTGVTLMAVLPGSGSTTAQVRAAAVTTAGGFSYPGVWQGDGTNAYWFARFRTNASVNVDAVSTVTAPNDGVARVMVVRFVNGTGLDLFRDGELIASVSSAATIGAWPSFLQPMNGGGNVDAAVLSALWACAMSDEAIRQISLNPWQLLRSRQNRTYFSVSGGGVSLSVSDSLHGHVVDSIALTQGHALALADASHAHTADGITLTQAHALALADAVHAHAADGITLTTAGDLVLADALHVHAADGVTLTQLHSLALADALHAHTVDGIALTQAHVLTISDALHAHLADLLSLFVPGAALSDSDRVLVIQAAGRILLLRRESRVLTVPMAGRSWTIN